MTKLFEETEKAEKELAKKREKEEKIEKKRKQKEFEAINEMKMASGRMSPLLLLLLEPIRYDAETGLKIYREDQLNLGKGGNTPLCPFDCDCCY